MVDDSDSDSEDEHRSGAFIFPDISDEGERRIDALIYPEMMDIDPVFDSNSCEQSSPELVRTLTASHPEFFTEEDDDEDAPPPNVTMFRGNYRSREEDSDSELEIDEEDPDAMDISD